MSHLIRIGGILGALGIAMCAPGLAFGESSAEAGWAKMTQCAAIADAEARHACTDDVLRGAGVLEPRAAAERKAFGLQKPAPSPIAAATAPPADRTRAAKPAAAPSKKEKEHVEVTLARVEQGADRKLVLVTSEGAVWHQVEGGVVAQRPKPGDVMQIEARSFGGFMCLPGRYVAFRCYRSR